MCVDVFFHVLQFFNVWVKFCNGFGTEGAPNVTYTMVGRHRMHQTLRTQKFWERKMHQTLCTQRFGNTRRTKRCRTQWFRLAKCKNLHKPPQTFQKPSQTLKNLHKASPNLQKPQKT